MRKSKTPLREDGRGDLCVGEVDGKCPDGFAFNNSPHAISEAEISGKTLIQSTRAGTVGVEAASNASEIYAASLMTAASTATAIRSTDPELVSIVAMGWASQIRTDEDEQCALYIRNLLLGMIPASDHVVSLVAAASESRKFDDPAKPYFHLRGDRARDRLRAVCDQGASRRRLLVTRPVYPGKGQRSREQKSEIGN